MITIFKRRHILRKYNFFLLNSKTPHTFVKNVTENRICDCQINVKQEVKS